MTAWGQGVLATVQTYNTMLYSFHLHTINLNPGLLKDGTEPGQ